MTDKLKAKGASPNPSIDKAIEAMMKKVHATGDNSVPPDTAVKIINTAIAWEKTKHHIVDDNSGFDPDLI